MALKPSKVLFTASSARINAFRFDDILCWLCVRRSSWRSRDRSGRTGTGAVWALEETVSEPPQLVRQADNSVGHEEGDEDEQAAEDVGPLFGESVRGVALERVATDRAKDRSQEVAASPERAPDHRL